jgi:hypothetical protein
LLLTIVGRAGLLGQSPKPGQPSVNVKACLPACTSKRYGKNYRTVSACERPEFGFMEGRRGGEKMAKVGGFLPLSVAFRAFYALY